MQTNQKTNVENGSRENKAQSVVIVHKSNKICPARMMETPNLDLIYGARDTHVYLTRPLLLSLREVLYALFATEDSHSSRLNMTLAGAAFQKERRDKCQCNTAAIRHSSLLVIIHPALISTLTHFDDPISVVVKTMIGSRKAT
ncbi:hypothetical protein Ddc_07072 [Ditylenchus destructor]|nr:hypothetical protein Ddc_07072 [Ditylenchus destructor]